MTTNMKRQSKLWKWTADFARTRAMMIGLWALVAAESVARVAVLMVIAATILLNVIGLTVGLVLPLAVSVWWLKVTMNEIRRLERIHDSIDFTTMQATHTDRDVRRRGQ